MNFQNNSDLSQDNNTEIDISDELELEFFELSQAIKVSSWAEPSWGISIFQLKPSWIFLCIAFLARIYVYIFCFYQFLNQKISQFKKKKYYLLQLNWK